MYVEYVTRQLRRLEKRPDADAFEALLRLCGERGIDLSPWSKRIEALRRKTVVHSVMRS